MAKISRKSFSILTVSILVLIIFLRLIHLQLWSGENYRLVSQNNFLREVFIPSPRGEIRDRLGRKIAFSKPVINLYLRTDTNENLEDIKTTLHNVLNINQKKLDEIKPGDFPYVSKRILIKKYLNLNQIYKIENELKRFQSLELVVDYLRIYPYGEVGAHKIGYLTTNDKKRFDLWFFFIYSHGCYWIRKKI